MTERALTRKELKRAESEAYLAHVRGVLDDAHAAAASAFATFMKSAKLTREGFVADVRGGASVIVYKPSYRLRTALKGLGEIEKGYKGAWDISNFSKHVTEQSMTAHETACQAACHVLRARWQGEGEFFMRSYID